MSINGIPKSFAPNNLAQQVADLRRKVEQLTSGRTYVNLERITVTEGGTIDSNLSERLFTEVVEAGMATAGPFIEANAMVPSVELAEKVRENLTVAGENIGETALDGKRIVGAFIETNEAANRGVKLNDTGLLAYDNNGNETVRLDGANSILTGATIRTAATGGRVQISGPGGLEIWDTNEKKVLAAGASGIEMEGTLRARGSVNYQREEMNVRLGLSLREAPNGARALDTPGVAFEQPGVGGPTDNILAGGLFAAFSGNGVELVAPNTFGWRQSRVLVQENLINIESGTSTVNTEHGGVINVGTWKYPATEELNLQSVEINIGQDQVSQNGTQINEGSNTYVYGNLLIGGAFYGDAQVRQQVALSAGWTHVTSNGWNGLWVEQMGKWTVITGCIQKGSYAWNEVMANLPAKFRPRNKVPGLNCEIDTAGNLIPGTAGSGARNISISYYAA